MPQMRRGINMLHFVLLMNWLLYLICPLPYSSCYDMRVFNNIAILIRAYRHIMVSNRNTVEYVSAGIGI